MFKPGDKVKVVKPASFLTIGKIYIVVDPDEYFKVHKDRIDPNMDTAVVDDLGEIHAWVNNRFELVIEIQEIDYMSITKDICSG